MASYLNPIRMLMLAVLMVGVPMSGGVQAADEAVEAGKTKWKEECGGCHVAFLPRFQPASVWRTLMQNLRDHFGSDASLETEAVEQITTYLEQHAVGEGQAATAGESYRASIERGRRLFNETHGNELRCASCHTEDPTAMGKNVKTEKEIEPLAPYVNSKRFTDRDRAERMFRRSCRYVFDRDCKADEKADVIAYLLTFNPPLRITETHWFKSRHRTVEPAVENPDECQICHTRTKSMSDCVHCHKRADNDSFYEHSVRIDRQQGRER